jgi:hypothetical protein
LLFSTLEVTTTKNQNNKSFYTKKPGGIIMTKQVEKNRDSLAGGLILVTIGLIALAGQFINFDSFPDLEMFIVPAIGIVLLLWGIITRQAGPIIPGGIMSGIGLGIVLIASPFEIVSPANEGGIFMLSFALGWVLITVLTAVFTPRTHFWPLIPAAIMALVGGTVLVGGIFETTLQLLGKLWPLALIALGAGILLQSASNKAS